MPSPDDPARLGGLQRAHRFTLLDAIDALSCAAFGDVGDDASLAATPVAGAAADTAQLRPGQVFAALQGTRSHGLRHAEQAAAAGAVAALAGVEPEMELEELEELLAAAAEHLPVLLATDCDGVVALGRLARAWRRRMPWRVVGITGSTGKTSTKDLLRSMLEAQGVSVVAAHANHNNEIGVPLTLLAAGPETDVVVCEMGMRGAGQVEYLCGIADPDVGLVTNAGTSHIELLGSREAIVDAKAELLAGTFAGGVAIYPAAQPELPRAAASLPDRALAFAGLEDIEGGLVGEDDPVAVAVIEQRRTERGIAGTLAVLGEQLEFDLPVHGIHQARNLAAATCAAVALLGSTELLEPTALRAARVTPGRGDRRRAGAGDDAGAGAGVLVIDDAYNASPESMTAAFEELVQAPATGRRVAVLGWMAELGEHGDELHRQVGERAGAMAAIDELVVVGDRPELDAYAAAWRAARGDDALRAGDTDAAVELLAELLGDGDAVLVKASNSARLDRVVHALVERLDGDAAARRDAGASGAGGEGDA